MSIKQSQSPLPDFRNFGVILRIVLGVNIAALFAALVKSAYLSNWISTYVSLSAWLQPFLFLVIILLAIFSPLLNRLPIWAGRLTVVLLTVGLAICASIFLSQILIYEMTFDALLRIAILTGGVAIGLLYYLSYRVNAILPALAEARIQALTARIRPHFLFNSLNAVLSLIRTEPKRAEHTLEELADLFRVLMRDHRAMIFLSEEVRLCKQYLDIEKIRLGNRLNVLWEIKDLPEKLKIPPLVLQPLLENAVYHGIEPLEETGTIKITIERKNNFLQITLINPLPENNFKREGQHMALNNIRERLSLFYDLEAKIETRENRMEEGQYEYGVYITLPYRKENS